MPFRPLPLCIAASMIVGGFPPASAQPAAPPTGLPPLAPAAVQPSLATPPGRVGRIAAVTGPVSFHLAGAAEWQVASPNLPVTTGTALWVAPAGEAAIGIGGGNRTVLGPVTEFEFDRLDDQALAATQAQGESYLHLRLVQPGETTTVRTPRGVVAVATAGRYEIVSGDTEHPTVITVLDGAATLSGIPTTAEIGPGQTLTITGDGAATTPFTPSLGAAVQDAFLRHVLAEERPPAARPSTAPAIIAQMTGAEALYDVGEWSENAEYGPVWYPPVATYVPYRQGRWAYVAPWGWTWVDDAPWGFAPTHYGRWSQFDGRWGWVPGRDWAPDRRPVYAPALVGFLGGAALGFGRGPSVGWAPLGPRDPYRPPYQVNDRVVQMLNQPTGANTRIGNAAVTINRSAVTIVPTQVLTTSAQVAGAARPGPLPPSIGLTSMLQFRPDAAPTRATIGATQTVLRQVNPVGLTAPATHVGPGPALGQAQPGPSRGVVGGGPMPQIGPAAVLGGAALGAVAGGLLRPPPPRAAALPELRARGETPPGLAERQRPIGGVPGPSRPLPPVITPDTPRASAPGSIVGRGPEPGRSDVLSGPRPVTLNGAPREPVVLPPQERLAPQRPQQFAPPRQAGFTNPRQERFAPPRQESVAAPRQVAAPARPAAPQMERAAPRQGGHEGRPERPER